jgi:hypothetical protein
MANRGLLEFNCGNNSVSSSSCVSVRDDENENEEVIEFP